MEKLIRTGVFETNSSSSHSISISSDSEHILDGTTLVPDYNGIIKLRGGEFGWEWERFFDAATKANYCAVGCKNNDSLTEMLIEVIKEQTGAEEVIVAIGEHSYIDHDSTEVYEPAFEDKETLRNFIFNKKSLLYTGNDNSGAPPNFYDPANTLYRYEIRLSNSTQTFKCAQYPSIKDIEEALDELAGYVKLGRDSWEHYSLHKVDFDKNTAVLSYYDYNAGVGKDVYTEPLSFEIVALTKKVYSYVI